MSRHDLDYNTRRDFAAAAGAVDVTTPVAGFYRGKLRSGGVLVGIRLWYGAPHDPVTGEIMDRSLRWQAHANGRYVEFDDVWPACADEPISEADYDFYASRQGWAEENAPQSAYANPRRKLDPLNDLLPW